VQALVPTPFPVIGYPKAWTNGTDGLISGEAIMADIQTDEDYAKFKGQLKGKFVFVTPMRDVAASFAPLGHRYTEQELADLQSETDVRARGGRGGARAGAPGRQGGPGAPAVSGRGAGQNPFARRLQFFKDEGALAIIDAGRGDGGTVFVQSAPGVSRDAGYDTRTHHSNMDVYERIQEADMRQNAVIVAAFVYQTANRDDKLPRKPLPKPQARGRGTTPSGGF
jgi:hypothetical protein